MGKLRPRKGAGPKRRGPPIRRATLLGQGVAGSSATSAAGFVLTPVAGVSSAKSVASPIAMVLVAVGAASRAASQATAPTLAFTPVVATSGARSSASAAISAMVAVAATSRAASATTAPAQALTPAAATGFSPAATPAIFQFIAVDASSAEIRAFDPNAGGQIDRDARSLRKRSRTPEIVYRRRATVELATPATPAEIDLVAARATSAAFSSTTPACAEVVPAQATTRAASAAKPAVIGRIDIAQATSYAISAAPPAEMGFEIAPFDTVIRRSPRDPARIARAAMLSERYSGRLAHRKRAA